MTAVCYCGHIMFKCLFRYLNKKKIYLFTFKLVNVLKSFDELTTYFSEIQYATLSVINPSIEALKFEFSDGDILTSEELNTIINKDEININEGKYRTNYYFCKLKIKT